jgi:hypothetical protein
MEEPSRNPAALPSYERLKTNKTTIPQRYDRLIVNQQFASAYGLSQITLQFQPTHGCCMHRQIAHLVSRIASGSGSIHGCISVSPNVFSDAIVRCAYCNADANRNLQLAAVDRKRSDQVLLDSFSDADAVTGVPYVIKQDCKYVAA